MKTDWKLKLKEVSLEYPKLPNETIKYIIQLSDTDYDEAISQIGSDEYEDVTICRFSDMWSR